MYKRNKKEHTNLVRSEKTTYYQSLIAGSDNISWTIWRVVSEMTNRKKLTNNNIIIKNKR